jgi:hypothetical protein
MNLQLLWNDNQRRQPLSTDPGGETLASGAALVLPIALLDSPAPGPADLVALLGLVCVVGIAAIAGAGAIALPQRQVYYFSNADVSEGEKQFLIPWPTDFDACLPGWARCASLEASGGRYWNFDDALGAMQGGYSDASIAERLSERQVTDSGHCPGIEVCLRNVQRAAK